jgi:hypothetical protein
LQTGGLLGLAQPQPRWPEPACASRARVAEAARGQRTLEQHDDAFVIGPTEDEVHPDEWFDRLWNKGNLPDNF